MIAPEPPTRHSLWRELADGSAGPLVRAVVNLAFAILLTGLTPILIYFIALVVPDLNYSYSAPYVNPRDELTVTMVCVAGAILLAGTGWLWSRKSRHRMLWRPALLTIAIACATIILCVLAESFFTGAEEFVIFGLIFLGIGAAIVVWAHACYGIARGRPMRNDADGLPDIRCPNCNYRMVGLHESRCPECGTNYTLDELLARQNFSHPADPTRPTSPPPLPQHTH